MSVFLTSNEPADDSAEGAGQNSNREASVEPPLDKAINEALDHVAVEVTSALDNSGIASKFHISHQNPIHRNMESDEGETDATPINMTS